MTKFKPSYNDQSVIQLDDVALDAVVGGAVDYLSPQLALAAQPVGGWTFKDVFAKPTLGRFH